MKKRAHENHVITVSIDGAIVSRGTIKQFASIQAANGFTPTKGETLVILGSKILTLDSSGNPPASPQ